MRSIAWMLVSIAWIVGCGKAPADEPAAPSGDESGTCYHPTDGGLYDTAAECAKHNGTWARAPT